MSTFQKKFNSSFISLSRSFQEEESQLLYNEAKQALESGNFEIAYKKIISSLHLCTKTLKRYPYKSTLRQHTLNTWLLLEKWYNYYFLSKQPSLTKHSYPSKTMKAPYISPITFIRDLSEIDWKAQYHGKFGGPRQKNISWKHYYKQNESIYNNLPNNQVRLMWAIEKQHINLLKTLLSRSKIDRNITNNKNSAHCIEIAVQQNNSTLLELLLKNKVSPNVKGLLSWTPLHWAAYFKQTRHIELLLKYGAKVNASDNQGLTPLHIAILNDDSQSCSALIQHHATIYSHEKSITHPLHLALIKGNPLITKILLDKTLSLNYTDNYKCSLLHWVVILDHDVAVNFVIEKITPSIINKQNDLGQTALHWAAYHGNRNIVQLLLDNGAQKNIVDKFEQTPLVFASSLGKSEVIPLFLS